MLDEASVSVDTGLEIEILVDEVDPQVSEYRGGTPDIRQLSRDMFVLVINTYVTH